MANKIADHIGSVTRRGFLSGTAGAIAASGAALLPAVKGSNETLTLEQMAHALHKAVSPYADGGGPNHVQVCSPLTNRSVVFEMEILRSCSVEQIHDLLKPFFERGVS